MPTGVYKREGTGNGLQKGHPYLGGSSKGKHWKVKDTSKMGNRTGRKTTLGKHWKIKDTSNMKGCTNGFKKGHHPANEFQKGNQMAKGNKYNLGKRKSEEYKQKSREWHILHPNKKFNNTKIEQKIANVLNDRKIKFQQNIGIKNIANVDFYLPKYNVIIECDGCYYHNCPTHYPDYHKENRIKDERKTRLLKENDFKVYRFWGHEINESPENCVNKLNL